MIAYMHTKNILNFTFLFLIFDNFQIKKYKKKGCDSLKTFPNVKWC